MKSTTILTALLLLLMTVLIFSFEEIVTRRSSNDSFLDPCKAVGYLGDVALTSEEFRVAKKIVIKQTTNDSLFEVEAYDSSLVKKDTTGQDEAFEQLQEARNDLGRELQDKFKSLGETCDQTDIVKCRQNKARLNEEILNIRIKWMQLKANLRQLKNEDRVVKDIKRSNVLTNEQPSENNNTTHSSELNNMNSGVDTKTENLSLENWSSSAAKLSRHTRGAVNRERRLWVNGVIPYIVDHKFHSKHKAIFMLAIELWEKHTCLVFKEREPDDRNYIIFTAGECGCCSFVGKGRGAQAISIGKGCEKLGIVAHELGHVIGFYHEHTRPDRNDYIQVIYENIKQGDTHNFEIQEDINSLNETYDFESVMHYSRNLFAVESSLNTLVPHRKPGVALEPVIGQRVKPSDGDIRQVNKLYGCPTCGRTLLEPADTFNHTSQLGTPDLCQWRISCAHGEHILLNITHLDVPSSYNCETDYVEVRDGYYIKSNLIGRFCGSQVPGSLTSTGNRMWIEFKTSNGDGKGFSAVYQTLCGGEIIKDEGFLSSPNYPDDYPPSKECVWKIIVSENFNVGFQFDFFDLENRVNCSSDFLEIRDGQTKDASLIGTFCGSEITNIIKTTGRNAYVKFVSNKSRQKSGFSARFVKEIDECETDDHGCEQVCFNELGSYHCSCRLNYQLHSDGKRCEPACGGYIEVESGTITSPSFPDLYPADRKCSWEITTPIDHKIHLNFTHFDLEQQGQQCAYDLVRVSSGGLNLGEFCGYVLPAPITSTGNTLRIDFKSDKTVQNTGFSATFMADKDECAFTNGGCEHICTNTIGSYQCDCYSGFILNNDMHGCKEERCQFEIREQSGYIYSPNYPDLYPGRQDCTWNIITAPGHRVRLRFIEFDLEPHQNCAYDHVAVFDVDDTSASMVGKFCGTMSSYSLISRGNVMRMTFFSDASVHRIGFEIEHDVVCGAHLVASDVEQHFVSHATYGLHNYDPEADCEWIIQAEEGRLIQLKFTDFELEGHGECMYDVVTVYDGLHDTDPVLGNFCGLEIPDVILSSTEHLLIHFRSDDIINRKGFSAMYQLVPSAASY